MITRYYTAVRLPDLKKKKKKSSGLTIINEGVRHREVLAVYRRVVPWPIAARACLQGRDWIYEYVPGHACNAGLPRAYQGDASGYNARCGIRLGTTWAYEWA